MRFLLPIFLLLFMRPIGAQEVITVQLPEIEIYADQLLNGDGDIYGLGGFSVDVHAEIRDSLLVIHAQILFEEGQNDQTTLFGSNTYAFEVKRLSQCQSCGLKVRQHDGQLTGKNIGARGFRRWMGNGIVHSALIQTDTFGSDIGKVGGQILLRPIEIEIYCDYVDTSSNEN
jgi:hypothetical protein